MEYYLAPLFLLYLFCHNLAIAVIISHHSYSRAPVRSVSYSKTVSGCPLSTELIQLSQSGMQTLLRLPMTCPGSSFTNPCVTSIFSHMQPLASNIPMPSTPSLNAHLNLLKRCTFHSSQCCIFCEGFFSNSQKVVPFSISEPSLCIYSKVLLLPCALVCF